MAVNRGNCLAVLKFITNSGVVIVNLQSGRELGILKCTHLTKGLDKL